MRKKKWERIGAAVLFLAGVLLLLYPTFSDLWNQYRSKKLITEYEETVSALPEDKYKEIREAAEEYNRQHRVNVIRTVPGDEVEEEEKTSDSSYDTLLNPQGDSIMGYLEIPKIGVQLPVYHGTGKKALENGCGHLEGTSLPIGGAGNHAVLSAHRGLPGARLFTDLDQLEEGDLFILTVLGEKLAYRVDQILTVLPEETDALAIEEGKDYVTLVTCTPYGVNSHRLLVRGVRTEYQEEETQEMAEVSIRDFTEGMGLPEKLLLLGLGVFLVVLILLTAFSGKKKR